MSDGLTPEEGHTYRGDGYAAGDGTVTIYTTPACPWCRVAKRYFAKHGIPFEEVDVFEDRDGLQRMAEMTGQYGVPVIQVGRAAVVGWDKDVFLELYGS
jgi:glutaredoxin 3